jgi:3'-phosphoadenosine 5'-phosphosulfate sulfotransferase (PAPS reductase)/FAD synthetase
MGSHYDEYYEERAREDRAYYLKQVEEKVSEIQKEITEQFPNVYDFKGYKVNLVTALAACRANKSNEVAIVNLLNEIVKELHK